MPAILKRAGATVRPRKIMDDIKMNRALQLCDRGLPRAVIATELSHDQATIHRRLVERGMQMRSANDRQR